MFDVTVIVPLLLFLGVIICAGLALAVISSIMERSLTMGLSLGLTVAGISALSTGVIYGIAVTSPAAVLILCPAGLGLMRLGRAL